MNPHYSQTRFRSTPPPEGWPAAFAVITACNPDGVTVTPEENEALQARFQHWLQEQSHWHWPVIGGSPDFAHAEPGFAVILSLTDALEVGRIYRQEAIFWVERDSLTLMACTGEQSIPLGSWRARLEQL